MLLPEPPLGQIPAEELASADEARLMRYLAERGLSLQDVFNPEGLRVLGPPDKKDSLSAWTREDRLRLALLYAEGLSVEEVTEGINQGRAARGSAHKVRIGTVKVRASNWLSPEAKSLSRPAQRYRNWHALMKPESSQTEEELKQLEAKFGLPRHLIFHLPSDIEGGRAHGDSNVIAPQARPSSSGFYDVPRLVHLMYLKFCKGASEKDLVNELMLDSKRELKRDLEVEDLPLISHLITKRAKDAIGLRVGRPKRAKPS